MRKGVRQLRVKAFLFWFAALTVLFIVVTNFGAFSVFSESKLATQIYRLGEKLGLVEMNLPKETVSKSDISSRSNNNNSVLGTQDGIPDTYYVYDEEAANPDPQASSGASSKNIVEVVVGDKIYKLPAPRCTRGETNYYVLKAEFVDNGMVLPASYVGFDKTAPEFVDPEKKKTAAIYQEPYREEELTFDRLGTSMRKATVYQNSREYATGLTKHKRGALAYQREAVERVFNAFRAPGEKKLGGISAGLYEALAKAAVIKDFEISLRFEGVNSAAQGVMRRGCNLQTRPIILGAPNKQEALKYANAYNIPLATAVVESDVLARERAPGRKGGETIYKDITGRSLSAEDERYYRYLLTTVGYDITLQAELPEDAGNIYKAAIRLKNWLSSKTKRLEDADRAVPLVAKGRNYTYVPMVCTCTGVAKRFNFKTFKIEEIPGAGTHFSCKIDFGKPILGNVDLPVSQDTSRAFFYRGKNMKAKMAAKPPGDILQSSKLSWIELAYVNCRVDPGKAKDILEKAAADGERTMYGQELIRGLDGKYRERIEVLHDRFCKKHGNDDKQRAKRLLSTWLSNAGFFVQTVYFNLYPAENRSSGGGGSFGYGCSSELVTGGPISEVIGSGRTTGVEVISFMDPRISTEMLLERYIGGPAPKKVKKDDYNKQLSLLEKFVNFKAYVHERFNWDIVGYVLTLEGGNYKLELRDIREIMGDADISLPDSRAVYPLKF